MKKLIFFLSILIFSFNKFCISDTNKNLLSASIYGHTILLKIPKGWDTEPIFKIEDDNYFTIGYLKKHEKRNNEKTNFLPTDWKDLLRIQSLPKKGSLANATSFFLCSMEGLKKQIDLPFKTLALGRIGKFEAMIGMYEFKYKKGNAVYLKEGQKEIIIFLVLIKTEKIYFINRSYRINEKEEISKKEIIEWKEIFKNIEVDGDLFFSKNV